MTSEPFTPKSPTFVLVAFSFEMGLGVAAIAWGWFSGFDPLAKLPVGPQAMLANAAAALQGVVAALPLLVGLLVIQQVRLGPFVRLNRLVESRLLGLFAPLSLFELASISVAAGFGEEVLFRGLIQAALTAAIGPPQGVIWAITLAAVAFGMCHWITPTYAVLAGLVGVYLGVLFVLSDNLLAPLTAHAVYDFAALVYLTRWHRRRQNSSSPDEL